jgi:conjugal transfer pilus assembly protein TrbC
MLHFLKFIILAIVLTSYEAGACAEGKKEGFRIFVSFSMPESVLIKLDKIASQIGAKLIIRGLKDNSFKETVTYLKGKAVEIDPKSFEQFDIKQVPAFVISDGNKYDKLVGNVSAVYVLDKFINEGELKEQSQNYFKRLSNYESH